MISLPPTLGTFLLAAAALAMALAGPAEGCTVCDDSTAQRIRAGLIDADLGRNLLATLTPFTIVAGVVALVHFDRRGTRGSPNTRGKEAGDGHR